MSDQQGGNSQGSASSVTVRADSGAAAPAPEFHQHGIPENPRSRGFSPARDAREGQQRQQTGEQQQQQQQGPDAGQQQQQQTTPDKVTIDGAEWSSDQVREALAHRVEAEARKAALPQSPDKYELKLPADFRAPEGVRFEFDQASPEFQRFRQLAHARGVDQETFSDMLGVYAATKIGEKQQLGHARTAELAKLGTAASRRIDGIETWLRARTGTKLDGLVSQLRQYPVATFVEGLEEVIRQFSHQGGADYSQSGRQQEDNSNRIAGYENMSFAQKRAAQDTLNARRHGGG